MASLMQQRYRDGTPLPDHEIAHILIALLMAVQHTSSSSLSCFDLSGVGDGFDASSSFSKGF